MGVMDMLFGKTSGGTASGGGQPPVNLPAAPLAAPAAPAVSGTPAPAPVAATPPAPPASPLDVYAKLWDTPVGADGKPIPATADPFTQPVFTLVPDKVREQATALDFTSGLNPDLIAKVTSGGAEAGPALIELLNTVAQNAVVATTLNTSNMVNGAYAKTGVSLQSTLNSNIRKVQLADTPIDNPVLNHPAAQPMVHALRTTFQSRNPNAAPADINKQVTDLFMGLAEALQATTPAVVDAAAVAASKKTDWDAFLAAK